MLFHDCTRVASACEEVKIVPDFPCPGVHSWIIQITLIAINVIELALSATVLVLPGKSAVHLIHDVLSFLCYFVI